MSVSGGDWKPVPHAAYLLLFVLSQHSHETQRPALVPCPEGTYEIIRKTRRQCRACRLPPAQVPGERLQERQYKPRRRASAREPEQARAAGCVRARAQPWDVCGRVRRRAGVGLRPAASPGGVEGRSASALSALGGQVLSGQGRARLSPLLRLCDSFCSLHSCLRQIGGGELGTGSWRHVVCYDPPPSTSCPDPASSEELCAASDRGVLISPVQLWYNCAPRDSEIKAHGEKAGSYQSVFLSISHRGTRDPGQTFRGQVPWTFGQRAFPADQQSLSSPPCQDSHSFALHTQVGPRNPGKTLRLPAT